MLDNIRAHLHSEEAVQLDIEAKAAERLQSTFAKNRRAFQRYVPAMHQQIGQLAWLNLGVFCNKESEYNIVDQSNGRTFYGVNVSNEIKTQYDNRRLDAPRHQFQTPQSKPSSGLTEEIDAIVILGIGIGHHIGKILALHQVKHCIIYEPDAQLFFASLLCFDWQKVLAGSSENKVSLYFQVGQDGNNVISDLIELSEHVRLNNACIYKHYNCPTFNAIEREFRLKTWSELKRNGIQWAEYSEQAFVLPKWLTPSRLAQWQKVNAKSDPRFLKNIEAFKRYFPELASEFADYQPQHWWPRRNASGEINLLSTKFPETYHGDSPKQEGLENYQVFARHPNKDGLVLGYDGTKLKEYTHYRFVSATETLIEELEEQQAILPEAIKAIIVFGLTSGYALEAMVNEHSIENLFVCEPEPDFFYASLFAIDWDEILTNIDKSDGRIYINIGDNGTNLFRDLISQFYAIGPYLLVNTFFYQTYYREDLVAAVNQLREQLQVVIAMGECYDHARYGIAHTVEMIERGTPLLRKEPSNYLTYQSKETPVFIVGNGPSLDQSIDAIKSHMDKAIIVSCGTALQVLFKNGILPDYHAEIEQNRSTYDWVSRSSAIEFTKQITLVSCNGIHPDTCQLFKRVQLAFKEGESSTVSNLNILGEGNWQKLEFAFPTVTNFAINLFLELAFSQLYLLGVDLGFIDDKTHHSKQSGYYDSDGNELYDYSKKNRMSISVLGNFRSAVLTKYEFKVSKEIIEQSLRTRPVDCFNCSDGVRIFGTTPLHLDRILLVSDSAQKAIALSEIDTKAFKAVESNNGYQERFYNRYSREKLHDELDAINLAVERCLLGSLSIEELMQTQKNLLHESYQAGNSLLFYLLYGTSNYANAVFSKLQSVFSAKEVAEKGLSPELKKALESWSEALSSIKVEYEPFPHAFDFAYSMHIKRELSVLAKMTSPQPTYVICDTDYTSRFIMWFDFFSAELHQCLDASGHTHLEAGNTLMLMIRSNDREDVKALAAGLLSSSTNLHVIVASESIDTLTLLQGEYSQHCFSFIMMVDPIRTESDLKAFDCGERIFSLDELTVASLTRSALIGHQFDLLLPKMRFAVDNSKSRDIYLSRVHSVLESFSYCCDFPDFFVASNSMENLVLCDGVGNRGRPFKYSELLIQPFKPLMQTKTVERIKQQFGERYVGGFPL